MTGRPFSLVYIIIGHRSNKIQSLLDIDEFFSFFFKKTQNYLYFYFFENCYTRNWRYAPKGAFWTHSRQVAHGRGTLAN
jgi:CCR4-NOT transcriptional regulation complex NOT5 subunit